DHWGEHLVDPTGARLRRGGSEHPFHELRVPGAGERDRLREARGLLPFEAVESFLVEQHRNPETSVVLHPALDGVREFRLRPSAVTFARSLDASDAGPKPVGRARGLEPARAI